MKRNSLVRACTLVDARARTHRQRLKETSRPLMERIGLLWCTKLFKLLDVWGGNRYTRPAPGQLLITTINLLAACHRSALRTACDPLKITHRCGAGTFMCVCVWVCVCVYTCVCLLKDDAEGQRKRDRAPSACLTRTRLEFNTASVLRSALTI